MTVATETQPARKTRKASPPPALGLDVSLKLAIAHAEFNAALHLVLRAVAARPSHPILANILLVADAEMQTVSLSVFDLSLGIQITIAAEVAVGGSITVPAKLLGAMVSRLPDGTINLFAEEKQVTLEYASGRCQLHGMEPSEFPELPEITAGDTVELSVESLRVGLHSVLFAASSDETKQMLCGVRTVIERDRLEFATTDGHRLAVVEIVSEAEYGAEGSVTIPAKALQELSKMLDRLGADHMVTLTFDSSQAVFTWEGHRLTSRLLKGAYPNYRQLMPQQFARQTTLERKQLLSALERIAVLADQKNNIVKVTLDEAQQQLLLSVEAQDVGNGKEIILAQVSGDTLEMAFNIKYLIDGLKAITTSEVVLRSNTATSLSFSRPWVVAVK